MSAFDIDTPKPKRKKRPCSVPDCGRHRYAEGLCIAHRTRQQRGQPLDTPIRVKRKDGAGRKPCNVFGCYRVSATLEGICAAHARRKRLGDENWQRPIGSRVKGGERRRVGVYVSAAAAQALRREAKTRGFSLCAWMRLILENAAKIPPAPGKGLA